MRPVMKNKLKQLPPGDYETKMVDLTEIEIVSGEFKGTRLYIPRKVHNDALFALATKTPINWKKQLDNLFSLYDKYIMYIGEDEKDIELLRSNYEIAYNEFLNLIKKEINDGCNNKEEDGN